jgi:threonine dehydratase
MPEQNPAGEVTSQDAYRALQNIANVVRRTPLVRSLWLSDHVSASVYLKIETLQNTGSFKIRGVANKLSSLSKEERKHGVITVSSGNHGQAVSHVSSQLGIPAVVCLSEKTPQNKIESVEAFGAETVVQGRDYKQAESSARRLQKERILTWIDPFDDPLVIAGQGTIAIELLEDLADLDVVVVPIGGGGLIAGIGMVIKQANPTIQVIGVQMERGPVLHNSLQAGSIVKLDHQEETLADGLAGAINLDNKYSFRMCQRYIDRTVLVSEKEIAQAMLFALEKHRLVVEGAGAVGIAAVISKRIECEGKKVAVVLSGGNVDLPVLRKIIDREKL